jgi:hypothetical protein
MGAQGLNGPKRQVGIIKPGAVLDVREVRFHNGGKVRCGAARAAPCACAAARAMAAWCET